MKKNVITDLLILIIIASFFSIAYATGNPIINAAQNAIDEYKPDQEVENDALQEYMNKLENEMIYSNAILNAAQNASKEYEEALKKEQEQLNKFEASLQGETLVKKLEERLNVYKDSVQIDNKLYLKYSNTEKSNIYKLMTSNAQKMFEKNANYFKKSGVNYYDTGRLRTLPIIYYTDILVSELELTSATENAATFDVITKNIVSGEATETYKDGLKIVKKDGEWLIDSLKFKSTVEEFDYYPEFVVIEEEKENTQDKQENNKTEENKKEENKVTENTITEELTNNEVVNTNKVENTNNGSNEIYISNQITDATTTGKKNSNTFMTDYGLYIISGVFGIILAFVVYKVFLYSKKENNDNNI